MEGPSLSDIIFEKSQQYSKTSVELVKLKLIDQFSGFASKMAYRLVLVIFMVLFFFIFNMGLSLWIGELLQSAYLGFFIVAGFYLLVGLLSHFFMHKMIVRFLVNSIISKDIQS